MSTDLNVAETLNAIGALPIWLAAVLIVIGIFCLVGFFILRFSKNEHLVMLLSNKANYNLDMFMREKLYAEIKQIDEDAKWEIKNYLTNSLDHNFGAHGYCVLPREMLLTKIESRAERWIDQNHLLDKIASENMQRTKIECVKLIESITAKHKYIMDEITCDKIPPDFAADFETKESLHGEIVERVEEFLAELKKIIKARCEKKITLYNEFQEKFKTKIIKRIAVDEPLEKNKKYLTKL